MERSREKCRRDSSASSLSSSSSTTDDEAFFTRKKKQAVHRSSRRLTIEEAVKTAGSNFIDYNPFQAGHSGNPLPNSLNKKTAADSKDNRRKTFHGTGRSSHSKPTRPDTSANSGVGHQSFTQERFPPRSPFAKQQVTGGRPSFKFCAFDPFSPIQPSDNPGGRQNSESASPSAQPDTGSNQQKLTTKNVGRRSMVERAIQSENSSNFIGYNPFQAGTPSAPINDHQKLVSSKLTSPSRTKCNRRKTTHGGSLGAPSSSKSNFSHHDSSHGRAGASLSGQSPNKQKIGNHVGSKLRTSFPQSSIIKELSPLTGANQRNLTKPPDQRASHPIQRISTYNNPALTGGNNNNLLDPTLPSAILPWKYYPPLVDPVLSPNFYQSKEHRKTHDS